MRRPIPILTLLLVAAALALAGCGGGGSKSSSSSGGGGSSSATTQSGGATTQGGAGGAAGAGGGVAVKMQNIAFSPKTVTVKVGQQITWTNEDSVPHNVVSRSGEKISSPTFNKGGTFSFTPKKAGTINYVCTIHPGMEGTIVVK